MDDVENALYNDLSIGALLATRSQQISVGTVEYVDDIWLNDELISIGVEVNGELYLLLAEMDSWGSGNLFDVLTVDKRGAK